ncbi:MAG: hypothetical protein DRN53_01410 [Thermoprotei archaeon]|nr:MAG: hypothetical protein DRN53_01410 [Thermoprotei archaeon]
MSLVLVHHKFMECIYQPKTSIALLNFSTISRRRLANYIKLLGKREVYRDQINHKGERTNDGVED